MDNSLIFPLLAVPGLFVFLLILRRPYIGLAILVASLLIIDILPPLPFVSSIYPILGAVTIAIYLLSQKQQRTKSSPENRRPFRLLLLFIFWMFISNPSASLSLIQNDRIWLITFIQLLILVWLTAVLMDEPYKHIHFFIIYSVVASISAVYAIANGGISETVAASVRSDGLAGAANSAARYFVVGIVMMYYLRLKTDKPFLRFLLLLGMGVLFLGTLYTVSRTGLVLLVFAVGMLSFQHNRNQNLVKNVSILALGLLITWVFADNIIDIFSSILPAVLGGTDTIGLRYRLWQAGLRMWWDYPVQGVGIGQFPKLLKYYGSDLLAPKYWHMGAHNMYIQILAETGLVGFITFMAIIFNALRTLTATSSSKNDSIGSLAKMWLIILGVMLLGGMTKHDHYDKLLWVAIGICAINWKGADSNEAIRKN